MYIDFIVNTVFFVPWFYFTVEGGRMYCGATGDACVLAFEEVTAEGLKSDEE